MSFLYNRIIKGASNCSGTLAEPDGAPEPRFALQATVNWMHALSIMVKNIDLQFAHTFYSSTQKFNKITDAQANTIFEQLLMSIHHLSALKAMSESNKDRDLARVAVMTWYYGIYCSGSAMIAAKDGSQQQDHTGTANSWVRQFAVNSLVPEPFNFHIDTLIKKISEPQITTIENGTQFDINSKPTTPTQARSACASYLRGSREYYTWIHCDRIKKEELSKLNLKDFRTSQARLIRDNRLQSKQLGFLHQAFRYRGKANYRDAIFLTFDPHVKNNINGFISDMESVLKAFVIISGAYCYKRVPNNHWGDFIQDLNNSIELSVMPKDVWPLS